MPMKNELAGDIGLAAGKSQYDAQCKRILANKIILAWILKYTVKEFKKMSIRQIKQCIGNDIMISKVRVDPGKTNIHEEPEKIIGESGEDKVPGEGEVYFDIRFSVYLPRKREKVKMIVNVEAQKDFHPGYAVPSRGVFYGARMISAQKGIEFTGSNYDGIRKVYSIWICMNAPDYIGNAVSRYSIKKEDILPGIQDEPSEYDKLTVVQICLNPRSQKGNRLTGMLNILLSSEMKAEQKIREQKIRELEENFHIPMTVKMGKELNQMCNLSDYVEEIGIKKGMEKGMERGRLLQQIEVIQKKFRKGKPLGQIAEEMEETVQVVEEIYRTVQEQIAEEMEETVQVVEEIYRTVQENPSSSCETILEKLTDDRREKALQRP